MALTICWARISVTSLGTESFDRLVDFHGVSVANLDLFPETTDVLFSDISGFTAWSSVREARRVFTLLENIYGAFDAIAVKRGVLRLATSR